MLYLPHMPEQSPEEQFVPDNEPEKIPDEETHGYLDLRSLNEYDKELLRTRYPSLADKIK